MKGESGQVAASVEAVRRRIDGWRESRTSRTRMPEELWDAAVSLAREHGAWKTSRALRVRYDSLKRRFDEVKELRDQAEAMRGYMRQAHDSLEQNQCAEIKR